MNGFLLVVLILWIDPKLGLPVEQRYEVRFLGHYNTLDRCESRRRDLQDSPAPFSKGRMLWSECRAADFE